MRTGVPLVALPKREAAQDSTACSVVHTYCQHTPKGRCDGTHTPSGHHHCASCGVYFSFTTDEDAASLSANSQTAFAPATPSAQANLPYKTCGAKHPQCKHRPQGSCIVSKLYHENVNHVDQYGHSF